MLDTIQPHELRLDPQIAYAGARRGEEPAPEVMTDTKSFRARDPILVYGAPRSGTTYLRAILDRHPNVTMTGETRVFEWLYRVIEVVPSDRRAVQHMADEFVAYLRGQLPDLIRGFYEQLEPQTRYWGDKNPHYAEDEATLKLVLELFPGTRIVHIVRDPRDVLASLLRKHHPDGTPWTEIEPAHAMVVGHVQTGTRFGRSLPPDRYHELRYEDLVADDVAVAAQLFEFLQIDFVEEVVRFCRDQQTKRTPFSGPTTDIDATRRESAWWQIIPRERLAESLNFIAPVLLEYGYETPESLEHVMRRANGDGPSLSGPR